MKIRLVILSTLFNYVLCRDFILGMFKKNDFLVASDTLYKEITSKYGYTVAKYGRMFHCPITYFRVVDRLGVGRPPRVQITRGGLQKKYITIRMTASYGQPIGVNIYVGCENNLTTLKPTTTTTTATETTKAGEETTVANGAADGKPSPSAEGAETPAAEGENKTPAEGAETPAPEGGETPAAEGAETPAAEGADAQPAEEATPEAPAAK